MRESAFKILNIIDKSGHMYLPIIFDSIVRFISLLRENHRQLECYQREYFLIAHNKRAFTVELFQVPFTGNLIRCTKVCHGPLKDSLHRDTTKVTSTNAWYMESRQPT